MTELSGKVWEITTMDIVSFRYEGMTLKETCWLDGKPYFSARAIGDFLEYGDPVRDVNRIVRRNPHINDPKWSVGAKLATTDGKKYSTHVYDPIGLQLIIFESHQPKAIQFKVAAAHLVYSYMNGEIKPSKYSLDGDLVAASRQILSLPHGRKRRELIVDLADFYNVDVKTIYRRIEKATGERLKTTKGTVIHRKTAGSTKYPVEKRKVLTYSKAHPGEYGAQIKKALDLPLHTSHINRWLRESKQLNH